MRCVIGGLGIRVGEDEDDALVAAMGRVFDADLGAGGGAQFGDEGSGFGGWQEQAEEGAFH